MLLEEPEGFYPLSEDDESVCGVLALPLLLVTDERKKLAVLAEVLR